MANKKIVLINLPPCPDYNYSDAGEIFPHTGLMLAGAIFKQRGFTVKMVDGALEKNYEEKALAAIDSDTVLVCFSLMTIQVEMALQLSKKIKEKYSGLILWGGIHPILFPGQTVAHPSIDIVVTGEGYDSTLGLIDHLNGQVKLEAIKGIGFKNAAGEVVLTEPAQPDDIEKLPHFDFSILDDVEPYLEAKSVFNNEIETDNNEKVRLMPIFTGHGCAYKCHFCINAFLKRKYRFKSAQSIIAEVKKLMRDYGANAFVFLDEDFPISKKRLFELLDLIEQEKLKFYWRVWGRVSYFNDAYINRDVIKRLEKNGLRSYVMGAESGSQKVLDIIEKKITVAEILNSARVLNGTKIFAKYSFIMGLEGEKREDAAATYRVCAEMVDLNPKVHITPPLTFRYYPGSPIFDRIVNKYKVKLPQKIEDWQGEVLHEGFFKIDAMPWIWPDFVETVKRMNQYLWFYYILKNSPKFVSKVLGRLVRWRLNGLYSKFPWELHVYDLYNKLTGKVPLGAE
ncbi:MAG: radical SAM protein [Candidatus Margulisbacteria bacterium]|nr:radical SAM protein [Candidatus Margulisiibacteriota bacterium]